MKTEVKTVGVEAFEEIYPLLLGFENRRMSKEDWRRMLFTYPWASPDIPERGYALYADGKPVGFLGTIFSQRQLAGKTERVCSLSSWIVEPAHRGSSLMLVMPILKLKGCTILNPTPSPDAYEIFRKLGFLPLENERFVLPPLPGLAEMASAWSGSFSRFPEDLLRELSGASRAIYDDLSTCGATEHVLLRHGKRQCYVVATGVHRRGLPFAEIQYISDKDFFWEHRILVHRALFPSTRAVGLWVDKRFAGVRRTPWAASWHSRRLYRPTRKDITPQMIDGLYSELMSLKW
jgi:hypothetical protein